MAFDDLELVGEAGDGAEAVAMCGRVKPDVVLMDLVMPQMDGASATAAIRAAYPDVQVIALTSFKEDDLVIFCGVPGIASSSDEDTGSAFLLLLRLMSLKRTFVSLNKSL